MTAVSEIPRVGQADEMSQLAARFHLPLCGKWATFGGPRLKCTRAAGHHESKPDHASTPHVAADRSGVALAVWS